MNFLIWVSDLHPMSEIGKPLKCELQTPIPSLPSINIAAFIMPTYPTPEKKLILFLLEASDFTWILILFTFLEPLVHLGFPTV